MTLETKKAVLAYSGGLDTSAAIVMLKEAGYEVVAALVDVGQKENLQEAAERAERLGALKAVVVDKREEFASEYLTVLIAANALYEGSYPLISSVSRPLIARTVVEIAREEGAGAVAHGCTGKGNDQVRFETAFSALAPDLQVLAPIRERGLSRPATLEFLSKRGYDLGFSEQKLYSIDANLWGRAIECGVLEDPWAEPPEDVFELTQERTDQVAEVVIGFEGGRPTSLNGEKRSVLQVIEALNDVVGSRGWGRIDMVENRRVGIKSREIYEAPAALALIRAHKELEALTLEKELQREKARIDMRLAELVYDGGWFSPLFEAIRAFLEKSQERVSGEVRLRVGPRWLEVVGRRSAFSLYDRSLATYEEGDVFDHASAQGFIRLSVLGIKTWAERGKRQQR